MAASEIRGCRLREKASSQVMTLIRLLVNGGRRSASLALTSAHVFVDLVYQPVVVDVVDEADRNGECFAAQRPADDFCDCAGKIGRPLPRRLANIAAPSRSIVPRLVGS